MKLNSIVEAFPSLKKLYMMSLPYSKTHLIMEVLECVKKETEFYVDQEYNLAGQYARKDKNGNLEVKDGKISFPSANKMDSYLKKLDDLRNIDIKWDFPIIKITEKEMGDQCISGKDIENLKGFIEFGGE